MYHKVCREYIPNGANLTDDEVDEVSFSRLYSFSLMTLTFE